jgi:hypothetical protein
MVAKIRTTRNEQEATPILLCDFEKKYTVWKKKKDTKIRKLLETLVS